MSVAGTGFSINHGAGLGREEHDLESRFAHPKSSGKTDIRLKLYEAAVAGDWEMAQPIYDEHPEEINATITERGETALHISAMAEQSHFAKQLIVRMSEDDLALTDKAGKTAFSVVAITKRVGLAKAMLQKNENLAMIRCRDQMLPLSMAVDLGHREMVLHLYKATKDKLEDEDRRNLLVPLIEGDIYDIALEMLKEYESLATAKDKNDETALHALARKPHVLSRASCQSCREIWLSVNLFSGSKQIQKLKLQKKALELVQFVWDRVKLLEDSAIPGSIRSHWEPIFIAAEEGNEEFLRIVIRSYPDVVFKLNEDGRTIFHIAILHRHENVFELIHEIGAIKNVLCTYKDNEKNNMLHLVGKMPPPNRLNAAPGAALQLQRELVWFEEVKNVVKPHLFKAKNKDGQTPVDLFIKEHMDLTEKGEKWMRDTVNSCTFFVTLVAAVAFAAAFTVPGGNKEDTGLPIFLMDPAFLIFAVSDAISLIFSISSGLTFLSILTSRYRFDDFHRSLPNRLVVGLTTLFISIFAMMMAFLAAIFIVFKDGLIKYAVPIAVISPIPIVLFIWLHGLLFRVLLRDVIKSTYLHWSLFQPNRRLVFKEDYTNLPELFFYICDLFVALLLSSAVWRNLLRIQKLFCTSPNPS